MIEIDIQALSALLLGLILPFFRILACLQFGPVLDNRAFSLRSKIALALTLSIIISPQLPEPLVPTELLALRTFILVGEQLLWGLIFGMALQMVLVALQTAGHILSMAMGLSMAVMNDPANGNSTTVISQIIFVSCALLFFTMDGHLLLVTLLYKGFTYWPIGQAIHSPSLVMLVQSLGWMIAAATLIALPATLVMLIVQGGFALLNRLSPTLNLFSLGFPLSMLVGLLCLLMLITRLPEHYLNLTNQVLVWLDGIRTN